MYHRIVIRALFLALFLCLSVHAQKPSDDGHCLERLKLPEYPPLAIQAQISGEIKVVAKLNENSATETVEVIDGDPHPILYGAVLDALRQSTFVEACHGRAVKMVFRFALEDSVVDSRRPSKLYFGHPNRFWIVSQPVRYQP